ncbi:ABC transporter substrate-binding protein [Rugosimonospora africana]|uniref:ABC transporter substrate-binding protein n=1 Tax=Rugosimonospora africana TaxID=556532 RepID=A0A8J3QNE1_9ACTN|nr:ABC transporter substrate-binding protein [Rugosimonospora africana]GIH13202.1 ABC transporter substrate-binding protein [Rugosimonospora africana]
MTQSTPDQPLRLASSTVSRRTVLRNTALGAGALAIPGVLAACGKDSGSSGNSKTVTFGSNYSDAIPKAGIAAVMDAYQKSSGVTVKINTQEHNSFQENISRYLKGNPDDVFSWFAGNRMKFFAAQGLAADISDVWSGLTGFSDALKKAATGDDGKQYFVPIYNYPWAVFYRPSVWQAKGWQPPKTLDELTALCKTIKGAGMDAFAFADKDGWPAMGTFDQINMRTNGYDFHISLMAGKESWTDPKVKQVFETWASLLPYHQQGANGRIWQDAANSVYQKKSAMMVCGSGQIAQSFQGADAADLDFFPYPMINTEFGQDAVEAPIDGFMISKKAKNLEAAKALIKFLASPDAENAYQSKDNGNIPTNSGASTSNFSAFQKKCQAYIAGAKQISQFMDRDTRPDFASQVMIPSLQSFINKPSDIDSLLKNIDAQAKSIFATDN